MQLVAADSDAECFLWERDSNAGGVIQMIPTGLANAML